MLRFILKILLILFIIVGAFAGIAALNAFLYKQNRKSLEANKHILLLGDSNMECAINDSIFDNSINKASSTDSYFYSYLKLNDFLNHHSGIDTVLLSFAPHNLFDNGWLLSNEHIYSRFQNYYFLMEWVDFKFLIKRNPTGVITAFPPIIKRTFGNISSLVSGENLNDAYGGFRLLERDIIDTVKLRLINGEPLPFINIPNEYSVSLEESAYLNKIIELCDNQNVKLYLIDLPKRKEILNYPKYGVKEFYAVYDAYFSHIDFLDFSTFEMPDDHHGDFIHMNQNGSNHFSLYLNEHNINSLLKNHARAFLN